MKTRKKIVLFGLVGVLAAMALVGTALAQTPAPGKPEARGNGYAQQFLDRLAAALKIDRPALDSALQTAKDETLDKMVEDGRITRDRADRMKERDGLAPWSFKFNGPGRVQKPMMPGPGAGIGQADMLETVAGALNMSADDLRTQLRSGKSLKEIVGDKQEAVKTALLKKMKEQLDAAVTNGRLTREQADKMYENFKSSNMWDRMWASPMGGNWPGGRDPRPDSGRMDRGMGMGLPRF